MRRKRLIWGLIATLVLAGACSRSEILGTAELDSVELETLDGKTDGTGELRLRASGMTLWLKPTLVPRWEGDQTGWILAGRISRNVRSIAPFTHAGPVGRSTILSARKFEVALTDKELIALLGGQPLLIAIGPTSGSVATYHAKITVQPRFTTFAGDGAIFVSSWIYPVMDGFDLLFRGRLKTRTGVTMFGGFNDDDSEPQQTQESPTGWRYDWAPWALLLSGDPVEDPITFGGEDADGAPLHKSARIEMVLRQIAFTDHNKPLSLWPAASCTAGVLSCLKVLPLWPGDTERCGNASAVAVCLDQMPPPPAPAVVSKETFATDLRKAIISYYQQHEAEILASGGNTRPQALLIVDTAQVSLLSDPGENPLGYDLATHLVYSHPDVVFPGSDTVWFGVYRRSDGVLVELSPFN